MNGRKNSAAGRDDAADDLRRRARRRLVGAVAMVLAAVIVLPMVLDGENKPVPDTVAINIPSEDTPFQPTVPPIAAPQPAQDPAAVADGSGQGESAPPASSATDTTPDPRLPASLATITPVTPTAPPPKNLPKQEPAPEPAPPPRTTPPEPEPAPPVRTTPPNKAAAQKSAEAARALALLEGRPVPPAPRAPSASSSRYAVQVVAVRSREGADALLKELRGAGLTSYIETIKTPDGQVYRVRLGPFSSRSQAESAQSKLRSLPGGYSGNLVPM